MKGIADAPVNKGLKRFYALGAARQDVLGMTAQALDLFRFCADGLRALA